jgi:hypothetical protein
MQRVKDLRIFAYSHKALGTGISANFTELFKKVGVIQIKCCQNCNFYRWKMVALSARSFFLRSWPKIYVKSWQHWLLLLIPRGLEHFLWNSISGGRVSTLQIHSRWCEHRRVFQLWRNHLFFIVPLKTRPVNHFMKRQ